MLLNITVTTLWVKGNHLQTHLTLKHKHAADEMMAVQQQTVNLLAGSVPIKHCDHLQLFIDKSEISIPHMATPLLSVHGSFMM